MKLSSLIAGLLALPPILYWFLVYVFGVSRGILLVVVPCVIFCLLLIKFASDNIAALGTRHLIRSLPKSLLAYLPIAIIIAPGIGLLLWAEAAAYRGADGLNKHCENYITQVQKEVQEKVEKARYDDASVWWKPWTWGDKVRVIWTETVTRTVTEPVLHKARLTTKVMYGSLVSILDILVIISRTALCCLVLVSFAYVYSMIVLTHREPEISL